MKKTILSFTLPLSMFLLAVVFIKPVSISAQTVMCPVGYTCVKSTTSSNVYGTPLPTPSTTPTPVFNSCYQFSTNLTVGSTGADVVALQTWLLANGYDIPAISSGQAAKGRYGSQTASALARLQANIPGDNEDGYFGPITRAKLNTCTTPVVSTSGDSIKLISNVVGLIDTTSTVKSYQVNMSFQGGTSAKPVSTWFLTLNCPSGMDANTSPGTSCNSTFQMGTSGQNYGNVSEKAFWFKNYNNTSQSVTAILKGYDSANNLLGTDQKTILVPNTSSGPQTWSQVSVLSPNGGQTFTVGQSIPVQWKTTVGDFQYLPTSRTQIYLLKDRTVVATYDNLPNNGSVNLPIGSNITAGTNYKISVTVYAENTYAGTAQADESDSYITIVSGNSTIPPVTSSNTNPILNPSNGYRPTGTVALGSAISINLTSTNEDKVGAWTNFGPGKAYINQNPADNGFTANLTLSQTTRTIKAITIFYNYSGQGCSTSRSFDTFGVDPYPMVVFKDGVQQNTSYDVALGTYQPGMYTLKLYCQPESTPFNGGKLLITFTDGTYVTSPIDAPNSGTQLPTQPVITSISPSTGPVGTIVELKGSNLAGFESDLNAWIQNSNGEVAFLPGIDSVPRNYGVIRVKIDGNLCKKDNSYSGLPCTSYLTITPGTYNIYTSPWGNKSNQVQFTVTPTYATPSPSPTYSPSSSPTPTPSVGTASTMTSQARIDAVNQMFKLYLNRLPDQQGLNYFVNSSLTIDQIRQIIVSSPEYRSTHSGSATPSPTPSVSPTIYY